MTNRYSNSLVSLPISEFYIDIGEDYDSTTAFLSFVGNESYTINITIIDDQELDGNKTFLGRLSLESPHNNLVLNESTIEISIIDNGLFIGGYQIVLIFQ